jgi:hypothetical protein
LNITLNVTTDKRDSHGKSHNEIGQRAKAIAKIPLSMHPRERILPLQQVDMVNGYEISIFNAEEIIGLIWGNYRHNLLLMMKPPTAS